MLRQIRLIFIYPRMLRMLYHTEQFLKKQDIPRCRIFSNRVIRHKYD
jgi:hypothetical protein